MRCMRCALMRCTDQVRGARSKRGCMSFSAAPPPPRLFLLSSTSQEGHCCQAPQPTEVPLPAALGPPCPLAIPTGVQGDGKL